MRGREPQLAARRIAKLDADIADVLRLAQHAPRVFDHAGKDRSKAFELKRELDRLNVFKEYEDRFLDLFKKPG